MASKKSLVNLIFACIVLILGLTAASEIYLKHRASVNQRAASGESADIQLPEDHPSPEAIERLMDLEQKIAEYPQNADYRTQMGNEYYDLGQYDKAADFYQQSLEIRPEAPGVETDLSTCYRNLGQVDKALETLDKVLQYRPGFPQAMFNKGIILVHEKNDVQGAIAVWEDLLRLDPSFSQKADLEQKIRQLKAAVK